MTEPLVLCCPTCEVEACGHIDSEGLIVCGNCGALLARVEEPQENS